MLKFDPRNRENFRKGSYKSQDTNTRTNSFGNSETANEQTQSGNQKKLVYKFN